MYKIFAFSILLLGLSVSTTFAQRDYCFKNDGLKNQQTVSFTLTGSKLAGTFESGGYDTSTSSETFEFTGRKAGSVLTIKFAGKPPYELPPGTKTITWTLGAKSLTIPTFGKNYNTRKYSTYRAIYNRCKEI